DASGKLSILDPNVDADRNILNSVLLQFRRQVKVRDKGKLRGVLDSELPKLFPEFFKSVGGRNVLSLGPQYAEAVRLAREGSATVVIDIPEDKRVFGGSFTANRRKPEDDAKKRRDRTASETRAAAREVFAL